MFTNLRAVVQLRNVRTYMCWECFDITTGYSTFKCFKCAHQSVVTLLVFYLGEMTSPLHVNPHNVTPIINFGLKGGKTRVDISVR